MALIAVKQCHQPESRQEVVELLAKYGEGALLVAGGTFVHGLAARGLMAKMEALIDLHKAGLDYVKSRDRVLAIGAMATFQELAEADPVKSLPEFGAVRDALEYPPPQIRNLATVGGCTASACPWFDLPVAFQALGGVVLAQGPGAAREVALEQFFQDYFRHTLESGEFLAEVRLPEPPPRSASAFIKLDVNANDLAVLNVAVRVAVGEEGICRQADVIFGGGVGGIPARALSCEKHLEGARPSQKFLEEAAQAVQIDLHPVSDHRASAQYRMAVAKVLVRRALGRALVRLGLDLG